MRQIFEFACLNGHLTEKLVESDVRAIKCPCCTEWSTRLISTPRINLEGFTGAFPGAADKWVRTRAKKHKQATKLAAEKDSD
jgi:hypothetical protein